MRCDDLLKRYGTKADVARAGAKYDEGITRQMVQGWFERDSVPLDKQTIFEVDTNGELKADVSEEFRRVVAQGEAGA